jgi:hypothetical protein
VLSNDSDLGAVTCLLYGCCTAFLSCCDGVMQAWLRGVAAEAAQLSQRTSCDHPALVVACHTGSYVYCHFLHFRAAHVCRLQCCSFTNDVLHCDNRGLLHQPYRTSGYRQKISWTFLASITGCRRCHGAILCTTSLHTMCQGSRSRICTLTRATPTATTVTGKVVIHILTIPQELAALVCVAAG